MTQETSQIGDPRRAAEVAKEGKAIFSNQKLKSFASIEIPYVATYVDLSNNKLTNFNGFEPTSKLQTLIVDNNPLLTFQGFPANQMILHFSAKNTPISDLKIFRSLVLLTIGNQLETINGIPVTANERKEISGKALTEHFLRRNIVKLSKKQKNAVATQLADCLRRGYICDSWPAKMSIIQTATDRQENDPITVRVMRLVKMLGKDESLTDQIMEWIFAPKLPSEVVQTSQIVDERLTKQQMLINYMAEQLEELKKANASNMNRTGIRTATSAKQATKREPKVSEETRSAYQQMLSEVGVPLIENSHRCEIEERKEAEKDYEGLRKAALRLLRETDDVSDAEIAARLREQIA